MSNCKWLDATLLFRFFDTKANQKIFNAKPSQKSYGVGISQNSFSVKNKQPEFGVKFCVRYRPLGILEWILARGRWNDKGIWTEDGIFNDGKV